MDLKEVAALAPARRMPAAVRAPWGEDASLRAAVRRLREQGEMVVCVLPWHSDVGEEFECDRELVAQDGRWAVRAR
jgi:ATP phosphoribosyltransferase regulatory subunit